MDKCVNFIGGALFLVLAIISCGQTKDVPEPFKGKDVDPVLGDVIDTSEDKINYDLISDFHDFSFKFVKNQTGYLRCIEDSGYGAYNIDFVYKNGNILWKNDDILVNSGLKIDSIVNCFNNGGSAYKKYSLFEGFTYKLKDGDLYVYDEEFSFYRYDVNHECAVPIKIKDVKRKFKVKIKFYKEVSLFGPKFDRLYKIEDILSEEKNFKFLKGTLIFIRKDSQIGPDHDNNYKQYYDGYLSFMSEDMKQKNQYNSLIFTLK